MSPRLAASRSSSASALGADFTLAELQGKFDAVFLGIGLGGVNALGRRRAGWGVRDAVDFIAELRQAEDMASVPVGRRVVVIGGGMTAIDAAVQAKLLGAEEVTICYRRGKEAHERLAVRAGSRRLAKRRRHPALAGAQARDGRGRQASVASSSNTPNCATAASSAPAKP
jgi:NADPH-dependent glutamate synthase beta subunit-like oxidoreductase